LPQLDEQNSVARPPTHTPTGTLIKCEQTDRPPHLAQKMSSLCHQSKCLNKMFVLVVCQSEAGKKHAKYNKGMGGK